MLDIDSRKHDMSYSIRMCRVDEYDLLRNFIKNSWNENHIFTRNKALLDWQHLQGDTYNFVVAHHHESNSFHGVLGLISPEFYSSGTIKKGDDIWLAIWKVDKDLCDRKSIGTDLLNYVERTYEPKSISAIGINKQVSLLYKLMGFKTGILTHTFIKNSSKSSFRIGNLISSSYPRNIASNTNFASLMEVQPGTLGVFERVIHQKNPSKSLTYLLHRYVKHPFYRYRFFAVMSGNMCSGLIVLRKIHVNDSSCMRIVDFFGLQDIKFNLSNAIERLIDKEDSEYVDMLTSGVEDESLTLLGFQFSSDVENVPHLFEPFVETPVSVAFAYKSHEPFVIFKGDSDLDRPNL